MADNQSEISSSVVPGDSVSSRGGKKAKPGKAERAAKRAGQGGNPGVPSSATKAALFSAGAVGAPVPTPGKHPIVFQTGAGEPTRDQEFCYSPTALSVLLDEFKGRYIRHPRYVEFRANSGLSDDQFGTYLRVAFLLGLSQQTVHAHVNMGLPMGDYGSIASSEVLNPSGVRAVLTQFGEFSIPSLGTRFLLSDYQATVSRLVWAADRCYAGGSASQVMARSWLPMSANDRVTKVIVSSALNDFLGNADLGISETVLEDAVLSGTVPDAWESIKSTLGAAPSPGRPDLRDRFDFLFRSYADVGTFTTAFTTAAASAVLVELGLSWASPSAGHLNWQFNPKERFSVLADNWSRVVHAYDQFFSMGSGVSNRSSALGSPAQMVDVRSVEGVTVVKTHVALSAPQFSLSACFPPEGIFVGDVPRRVVVTTSVNVSQRATEFCLLDWKQ